MGLQDLAVEAWAMRFWVGLWQFDNLMSISLPEFLTETTPADEYNILYFK